MKALKIALPVFFILLILVAAYLYFFSGLNLSADYYIQAGDKAAAAGNANKAVANYSKAAKQISDDPELIIKLATAYSDSGNYTKAEYTLVGGINRLPDNVPLYVALSKTYVAQDKLMDAAILLDGVTNEYARAQLSEKRPAAPVISPDGGEYDEFFTVNISYSAGTTAYVSTDSDYPSKDNPALETEITTSYGTTSVYAVSVSEEGLVSQLAHNEYLVANVVEDVAFTDPSIENQVRTALGVDASAKLTTEDLWTISSLYIPSDALTLEDLRWFGKLPSIVLQTTAGLDLTQLSMCTQLRELTVANCGLSSAQLDEIGQLTGLTYLDISGNQVVSLSAVANLTGLTTLLAGDNSIFDLAPLSGLHGMKTLDLSNNAIEDIAPLWALTDVTNLDLSGNPLPAIDELSGMTGLTDLNINGCAVTDASALAAKPHLINLDCSENDIASLDMLDDSTSLETLFADNNAITSIDFIAGMTGLKQLSAAGNFIDSVPQLSRHTVLNKIDLSHNQISDISGIHDMALLNYLNLDYNNITDISHLTSCNVLVELDVFANPVTETDMLTDMGVIVNFGLLPEQEAALAAAAEGEEAPVEDAQ